MPHHTSRKPALDQAPSLPKEPSGQARQPAWCHPYDLPDLPPQFRRPQLTAWETNQTSGPGSRTCSTSASTLADGVQAVGDAAMELGSGGAAGEEVVQAHRTDAHTESALFRLDPAAPRA